MTKETSLPAKQRIWELDALRGLCILCMVAIHAFWDLSAFGGFAFDLPGWFLFCRQYGHILFILLSGLCATLASRSFQRGVYVFGAALVGSLWQCLTCWWPYAEPASCTTRNIQITHFRKCRLSHAASFLCSWENSG